MKLSSSLMYAGNPRDAADQVTALEQAGLDTIWVAEAYGFDSPTLMGYLAAKTETDRDRLRDPQHLLADPGRAAPDRRRPRQRQRRPRDPRPRRLRAAGDRGLPRRPLRQPARPHPRDHRPGPPRHAAREAHQRRHLQAPATKEDGAVTGLGKPLKLLTHPERDRRADLHRRARPEVGRRAPRSTPTAGCRSSTTPSGPRQVWGEARRQGHRQATRRPGARSRWSPAACARSARVPRPRRCSTSPAR